MGIRRVFGAPVYTVIMLLSKEFTRCILAANVIAWPAAYLIMDKWLENFAYKQGMGLSSFILAALFALGIAFLTIGYQSIKAAIANPIDALRYE